MAEAGAEFLFQVIAERAEKAAVIVTTNLPFSEWTSVIPNARLCKAPIDLSPTAPISLKPAPSPTASGVPWTSARAKLRRLRLNTAPPPGKLKERESLLERWELGMINTQRMGQI
jgi:hypothetical protein